MEQMEEQTALEEIHSYINNLLVDPEYDPHYSTIQHLQKILSLTKLALPQSEEEKKPETIISVAAVRMPDQDLWAVGACTRWPISNVEPHYLTRVLRKQSDDEIIAHYNAIYEAIAVLRENTVRLQDCHKYARRIAIHVEHDLVPKTEEQQEKWALLHEEMKELEEAVGIAVELVWYPWAKDIKTVQKMAQKHLGIVYS